MDFRLLTEEMVLRIHNRALNDGELTGVAGNKSLSGALSRVEFRVQYGLITDAYHLAAMYTVAIAQAHVFNDANKRTAYAALEMILELHDLTVFREVDVIGNLIIDVAQGKLDEEQLAQWLREYMR